MIKITLELGAEVLFPNLGTSVFMHESGLTVLDRCGEQRMQDLVLQNGAALSVKGNLLQIKEPYNWKVTVAVSGQMEIEASCITNTVSGAQYTPMGGFHHPQRGHFTLLVGDKHDVSIDGRGKCEMTALESGVLIDSVGYKTVLELE